MTEEFDPENPDLEGALDGLIAAANYCDDHGHHSLSYVVSHLYQILGDRELGDKEWYEFEEVFPIVRANGELQVGVHQRAEGQTLTVPDEDEEEIIGTYCRGCLQILDQDGIEPGQHEQYTLMEGSA